MMSIPKEYNITNSYYASVDFFFSLRLVPSHATALPNTSWPLNAATLRLHTDAACEFATGEYLASLGACGSIYGVF